MEDFVNLIKHVDLERLGMVPPLPYIARKAGVNPDSLLMFLVTVWMAFGTLTKTGQFISLFLWGFTYPAQKSLKSCGNASDEHKWLLYWLIFCSLLMLRPLQSSVLAFLPGHDLLISAFCIALYYPPIDVQEYFQVLASQLYQRLKAN